jgi:hypothetical protein
MVGVEMGLALVWATAYGHARGLGADRAGCAAAAAAAAEDWTAYVRERSEEAEIDALSARTRVTDQ